jgi:hypothetical protein
VYHGGLDDVPHLPGSFQAVTFSHVIEHLHDPVGAVTAARELLSTGGLIWIATPNASSLGRSLFGGSWRGLEPPRHLTVHTGPSLLKLLRDAGFVDVRLVRGLTNAPWYFAESSRLATGGFKAAAPRPLLVGAGLVAATVGWAAPRLGEELVVTARRGPLR